jgi:hypothetical protein
MVGEVRVCPSSHAGDDAVETMLIVMLSSPIDNDTVESIWLRLNVSVESCFQCNRWLSC